MPVKRLFSFFIWAGTASCSSVRLSYKEVVKPIVLTSMHLLPHVYNRNNNNSAYFMSVFED